MAYRFLSVAALAAAVCFASPAFACKGKNVLLEDNFADDSTLGDVSQYGTIADGVFKLNAKKGFTYHFFYQADAYDKGDICVDVTMLSPGDAGAGIIFNGSGGDYYYLWVNPAGLVGVGHVTPNKWLAPVPPRKVQLDPKKAATLRVTLDGDHATAYLNDQKVANF